MGLWERQAPHVPACLAQKEGTTLGMWHHFVAENFRPSLLLGKPADPGMILEIQIGALGSISFWVPTEAELCL